MIEGTKSVIQISTREKTKMKKTNKIKSAAICSILAISMLCGCSVSGSVSPEKNPGEGQMQMTEPETNQNQTASNAVNTDFNKTLIEFVENSGFSDKNYMVSPTSFRAALALAVAGADTKTKEELIHSMGFKDMDEVNEWYTTVTDMISDFEQDIATEKQNFKEEKKWLPDDAKEPDGALVMLNSIWNNTDLNGKFGKEYLKYVKKNYNAEANNVNSKNITEKVNKWVNNGTNGLIPSISNDLSNANAVLVNTLYLKSSWFDSFEEYNTSSDTFTTISGEKVQKEFMNQTERFRFYEDDNGKLIVLPLHGGVDAVFVLGSITDMHEALNKAEYEEVIVKLPKFDVETSFSQNEFIDYLKEQGAELAFTEDADFSVMCPDTSWYISDIIQKTRIKVNEDGIEAAAATAIMMTEGAFFEENTPKEFIADKPFKFYICAGSNDSEMLFCGQLVE